MNQPQPLNLDAVQTRRAIRATLEAFIADLDYDIHKGILCGEDDGLNRYDETTSEFIALLRRHLANEAGPSQAAQPLDLDAIQARVSAAAPAPWDAESTANALGDITALAARVQKLEAELRRERSAHSSTINERDRATDCADRLAAVIAPIDVIGEHSIGNCPWEAALHYAAEQSPAGPALTGWAADMADANLTPYDGTLTLNGDDEPFMRVHFAFGPDVPDAARESFVTEIGRIILDEL